MPINFRLSTWNTQGNFTIPAKAGIINTQFGSVAGNVPVVFLQEGGTVGGGVYGNWTAFGGQGVGAFNARCTNYILVDTAWMNAAVAVGHNVGSFVLQDGQHRVVVGGGDAGRTPVAIGIDRTMFVSWHSLASASNSDTALILNAVESNADYLRAFDVIVIAGDFNTAPVNMAQMIQQGTARTRAAWNYPIRGVVSSGAATHQSGNEIDYFVILSRVALPAMAAGVIAVPPSDHDPVQMNATF